MPSTKNISKLETQSLYHQLTKCRYFYCQKNKFQYIWGELLIVRPHLCTILNKNCIIFHYFPSNDNMSFMTFISYTCWNMSKNDELSSPISIVRIMSYQLIMCANVKWMQCFSKVPISIEHCLNTNNWENYQTHFDKKVKALEPVK